MHQCMAYCVQTKECGKVLKPKQVWNGSKEFEFEIEGYSDSDYAKDPLTRRSVSGWSVFLEGVPIAEKSKMQGFVTLSVTEAESGAAVSCAQDMLFALQVLESLELKVKKPMYLYMDNKGAVDLFNTWGISGCTRHVSVQLNFLHELKEEGLIEVKWCPTTGNIADIHTKNLGGESFEKHTAIYCGKDKYMKTGNMHKSLQGESVGMEH